MENHDKPKWIKTFKETPFSKLNQINDEGNTVGYDPSDNGDFAKNLFAKLDFEIIINGLPRKEKEATRLQCNGFKREEIAKEMEINPNAVKQLIYRGRKRIKKNQKII